MSIKKRIEKLESHQNVRYPMVAVLNEDGSYHWNDQLYPDENAFKKALRECEYTGKILVLDI
jgi:hypothetical protein